MVAVEQPAESLMNDHVATITRRHAIDQLVAEPLVRPLAMEVRAILPQRRNVLRLPVGVVVAERRAVGNLRGRRDAIVVVVGVAGVAHAVVVAVE